MERTAIPQRFLQDLAGPAWVAIQVEVLPGVVDSEIAYVTPEMDHLYGYVWPDTLVGHYISTIHTFAEAQITRQYAELRHWGVDVPCHYTMHGLHPNGRIFPVIKHVTQYAVGTARLWVTHHAPWHRSSSYPLLQPRPLPPLPPGATPVLWDTISVAHIQRAAPLLAQTPTQASDLPPLPLEGSGLLQEAPAAAARPPASGDAHPTRPQLGPYLQHARTAQQLSLRALALRCTALLGHRVTPQYLSNLEHGYRLPSLPLLRVLATVLALDPATVGTLLLGPPAGARAPRPAPLSSPSLLARVQVAADHLRETQQRYRALLYTAHQAGTSLRQLATVTGLSPSRIHQLVSPARPARTAERDRPRQTDPA